MTSSANYTHVASKHWSNLRNVLNEATLRVESELFIQNCWLMKKKDEKIRRRRFGVWCAVLRCWCPPAPAHLLLRLPQRLITVAARQGPPRADTLPPCELRAPVESSRREAVSTDTSGILQGERSNRECFWSDARLSSVYSALIQIHMIEDRLQAWPLPVW